MPKSGDTYDGVVVFVDGVHYPVDKNGDPDTKQGLRAADDGSWRYADDDEPLHNDVNHLQMLELPVGGEG